MDRLRFLIEDSEGPRNIAYWQAGDPGNPRVLLCVHGLTRNGLDFEAVAERMSARYRVICPDVAGRGFSDPLPNPSLYAVPTYSHDMVALLDGLDIPQVDWLGTSMGGLIGMALAGNEATAERFRTLILNDVGPFIPKSALERIGEYVGRDWRFESLKEAERHFRTVYMTFGPLTGAQWARLTEVSLKQDAQGVWIPNYDPKIGDVFVSNDAQDTDLWPLWDKISCPTLALRGEISDVLPAEVGDEMTRRGPKAELISLPGIGHAPALMSDDQIDLIETWLKRTAVS